jgi:hypothetical protein
MSVPSGKDIPAVAALRRESLEIIADRVWLEFQDSPEHPRKAVIYLSHRFRMFDRILKEMRDRIRRLEYIVSIHADEEMNDDCLRIFDVERCILTGKILERQKDKSTAKWKYRIQGKSLSIG